MGELIGGRWYSSGRAMMVEGAPPRPEPNAYRETIVAHDDATETAGRFTAERDRYHLYIALACPWANRAAIMRRLKGLEPLIGLSIVHWHMGEDGWTFAPGDGVVPDTVNGTAFLRDIYLLDDADATTRVSVPVLWDKRTRRIVSNESAEIIRMFNAAFDGIGARPGDYYPLALRPEIDALNDVILATFNRGVYRAGFATSQADYDEAVDGVFATLAWLDERLRDRRYLFGSTLTEADIRLFTTLVRFDPVYAGHFKCNLRPLTDYPAVWAYTRDLYQHPDFRPTIDLDIIKRHYYTSHPWVNPSGVVPIGPIRDFDAPHDRAALADGAGVAAPVGKPTPSLLSPAHMRL